MASLLPIFACLYVLYQNLNKESPSLTGFQASNDPDSVQVMKVLTSIVGFTICFRQRRTLESRMAFRGSMRIR